MLKIFLVGCCGRMGRALSEAIAQNEQLTCVGGLDRQTQDADYPIFTAPEAVDVNFDVLIDFSNPAAFPATCALARRMQKPAVVATTGLSAEQEAELDALAQTVPVFSSANMSLGVNILIRLVSDAARMLYPQFNIEILEAHHNQKLDAPSGTALMIGKAIQQALGENAPAFALDRTDRRAKRPASEIGFSVIRGGSIVGEHDVWFAGPNEILKVSHSAQSREIFANGALSAAQFLVNQKPGHYHMDDLIEAALNA